LLVLVHVFYRNRLLLLKRGVQPYRETWAPPGGFVESGESVEAAAVRELREEVGVELAATQLAAHAVVSVPRMNQVYHLFVAHLKSPVRAVAVLPESLEVGWFTWDELGSLNVWEPGASLEMNLLFDAVGCRRVEFYQQVQ
jgi:ADP-ribose pyrophosphatase YjhB (NUDIX family)